MTDTAVVASASPELPRDERAERVFYRLDSARVTMREYAWGTKNPLLLAIAAGLKVLRVRITGSSDDPAVHELGAFEVAPEALPEDVRGRVGPAVAELEGLGFEGAVYHLIDDPHHSTQTCLVTLRSPDGRALGRVHLRVWHVKQPPKVVLYHEFLTAFEDGGWLWTLGSKADMAAPPSCVINRTEGAGATALWASHRREAERIGKAVRGVSDVRDASEAHHAAVRAFHVGRGVFAPLTEADRARAAAVASARACAVPGAGEHAEVLAEIDRLQNKRSSWTAAVLVLGVSLLLFVGLGASQWSWRFVGLLIPILFFHELGHYVAMRAFDYKNVRMFFVPLFGAAVTGRHYNVAGWKKAIVYLAGPLPGILAGLVVGLVGVMLKNDLLVEAGLLALFLNAFNLLPVLPLDGGWHLHILLFSRHPLLDVAFRAVAAAALVAGGWFASDRILLFFGAFMLLGVFPAYRLARATADLRRLALPGASPDDQTIPAETACAIVGRLKADSKRPVATKVLAQNALHVFESLNSRPPRAWASLGLGAVHAGALVLSVVLAAFLVIQQRGGLAPFLFSGLELEEPAHVLTVPSGEALVWRGSAYGEEPGAARTTLVGDYGSESAAEGVFGALRPRLPETAGVRVLGQHVLLSLPTADDEGRRAWLEEMRSLAGDVRVHTAAYPVTFDVTFAAPDEATATALESDLQRYFQLAGVFRLVPPWVEGRDAGQLRREALARETYHRVQETQMVGFDVEGMEEVRERMGRAMRDGDKQQVEALQAEQQRLMREAQLAALEALKAEEGEALDGALVDAYAELIRSAGDDYVRLHEQTTAVLGPRLGTYEATEEGWPTEALGRTAALSGAAMRNEDDGRVGVRFAVFADPFEGASALVKHLQDKGGSEFRYEFGARFGEEGLGWEEP